jgi:hypothetical protein
MIPQAVSAAHVLQLAIIASHLSGYSMPTDPPPAVIELDTVAMHLYACDPPTAIIDDCLNFIGVYYDGKDIAVDAEWAHAHPNIPEDAIIVHELVHWLQWKHGYGGAGCPRKQARENEAYRAENMYLVNYLHLQPLLIPQECPAPT